MRGNLTAGTGETADIDPWVESASKTIRQLTLTQCLIYLVGLSEGLTHLAALAIYYFLKDDLGLSPPQVSAIFIVPAIPWILKPFFAFCSDSYPIMGYRRKSYMIIFSALEATGFVILGMGLIPGVIGAVVSLFIVSLSAAFCSCIAEGLVVQTAQGQGHAGTSTTVSDFVGSKAVGSLLVAYLSGYLLEKTSKQSIFLTTACFPLLITFVSIFVVDDTEAPRRNLSGQLATLYSFLRRPMIWGPAVYIFVYMSGPDYDDAMFFFFTNKLGFSPTFMGTMRFTYGIAAILGILSYKYVFHATTYKRILLWTIVASFPIYISPIVLITGWNKKLGISNQMFVLSGGFLIEATSEVQLLPLLVLITKVCPPGLEASVYGVMMSIRNLGGAVSRGLSALATFMMGITATSFVNLSAYVMICGICLLIPLFFLPLVPDEKEVEKQKDDALTETQQYLLSA